MPPIRPGRDDDGPQLIDLIRTCWSRYPGIVFDVDAEMPELHALATYYDGALWVAEAAGRVVGMIATRPVSKLSPGVVVPGAVPVTVQGEVPDGAQGCWEICRVYVHPDLHGGGLGHALLDRAEAHAVAHGATRLALWSDTRFDRAHRFYEKRSYVRMGGIRVLHDLSNSLEFAYAKPLNGVERLDAAGAASAERRLADILIACVEAGASVSFLPPLDTGRAAAFWHGISTGVANGRGLLFAGWRNGVLSGCVGLDLAMPENQSHRAEVQKLLVHPQARRTGLALALMAQAEQAALAEGRTLLTLDTQADAAGAALYRHAGWTEAGRIPGFARDATGRLRDTLIFWKRPAPAADGRPEGR
ncbi:GNAT family N-acetyltransferase [Rhodopila sp.]|uniref:GNAT family N-acetyltransferase n=1 Tax=Rhodopila sp. TaxID=2480087 RepID=UPI002CBDEE6F|nr:GNAT family N-acetyltransferase [Rhodopila sp.]HVZ09718.1 GNAT family N-acetyltransferase [Rhodopila sp.]